MSVANAGRTTMDAYGAGRSAKPNRYRENRMSVEPVGE